MNDNTHLDHSQEPDDVLDAFFDAAKAAPARASGALLDQVLADAQSVQDAASDRGVGLAETRNGLFSGLIKALGGWPALGGLATATVAGVWIGVSPALGVGDAMANVVGLQDNAALVVDLTSDFGFSFVEGDAG